MCKLLQYIDNWTMSIYHVDADFDAKTTGRGRKWLTGIEVGLASSAAMQIFTYQVVFSQRIIYWKYNIYMCVI